MEREDLQLLTEGKTKKVYVGPGSPHMVLIRNKDDITKHDDPDQTRQMTSKAVFSTQTTCSVFKFLQRAGIPTAYEGQALDTGFWARNCRMIPLEVVVRRYAVGSYLKRYPQLKKGKGEIPHRFHQLVFELFLKTSGGEIKDKEGKTLGKLPLDPEKNRPVDDPFISFHSQRRAEGRKIITDWIWDLRHPKIPSWQTDSYLDFSVRPDSILPKAAKMEDIEKIARQVFLLLEGAWAQLGCRLIDFKIEFGIDTMDNLVVADVIDNDSWRLRDNNWQELSKQLFRDNFDLAEVSDKFGLVAQLASKLPSLPKQAIVFWCGSRSDEVYIGEGLNAVRLRISNIKCENIFMSGHRSPRSCADELDRVMSEYPDGGVIIALVGKSNGLGPTLSARTSWPVIGVPVSVKSNPQDVWSNLRLPDGVPMLTALSPKNAVLAALNILAQKNPVAYMLRHYHLEQYDL